MAATNNKRSAVLSPTSEMRWPKGTKFVRMGQIRAQTVVDYHVTRNMAGEIVKARYLCSHKFAGQLVMDADITATSIARAEILHLPA